MFEELSIAIVAVIGGLGIAVYAMWLDGKKRELRHIERMAMIEKGMAPPALMDGAENGGRSDRGRQGQRRSGVFMICMGVGLTVMFALMHGNWRQAWIGAFIIMFGVAALINAWLDGRDSARSKPSERTPELPPR